MQRDRSIVFFAAASDPTFRIPASTGISTRSGASAVARLGFLAAASVACLATGLLTGKANAEWQTTHLHDRFYTEGAAAGDIDGDTKIDIVAGPLWFRGPDFKESNEIAPARDFPIASYSDQFFSDVHDFDGDGDQDVMVIGFPGQAARLYLNPGHDKLKQAWAMHEVADIVDNESPAIVDLIPGGVPEIVCGREGQYGYYQAGDQATDRWTWHPISRVGTCGGRFAHGLGVGDVNGDGRLDVLDRQYWWEHPATTDRSTENAADELWTQHTWAPGNYGGGGAQILVDDFDGDGDNDIVTSLNAHGFGLAWFEQVEADKFVQHEIMGDSSLDNPHGVAFSQLHALALVDIDGDGRNDIVTGKRWMAHHGKDVGGLQEPVLYWFRSVPDGTSVEFIPHLIDRESGVGTEVLVTDLNDDQKPDVVSSSKHGLSVHLQRKADDHANAMPRWKVETGRDQSKYADGLSPLQAAEQTMVGENFRVDLIAAEPELTQPIAMCFDARGRIWVIEGHTYPRKAPEGEGRDRVVIFEDTDADGTFETRKVFTEGLNLASGIEVGFGGVWIGAAPELLFIPDADRDDVPDGPPQVLLDGWGFHDTHETLNSFTWGPDGWLYGCHGVFTHTKAGKVGSGDSDRVPLNAGVWRYHPTQHRFEIFAHGTSNPWGLDYNDRGDWFITACVIPHLYHIQQGARYQRQAGRHFNQHTYDDIKTIADHLHYAGDIRQHAFWGENRQTKPSAPMSTSLIGGGHAHCGLAIYNGDTFPSEFYGDLLFHNLHGHRVVRERVEDDGSTYIGKHRPDFALARDHKEIGVGVMVGPDGAVYTSDWHDVQTCHNFDVEVWDRTDGRLFRIRYGEVKPQQFNLWEETDEQLVMRLQSDNGFFTRQAQLVLQHRASKNQLDVEQVTSKLNDILYGDTSQRDRLRALWTRWCIGSLDRTELSRLLSDRDPYVRGWAIHFIGEGQNHSETETMEANSLENELLMRLVQHASSDPSPVVRRYLGSLLQKLPLVQRWPIVEALASRSIDQRDRMLPLLVWYGLEPLTAEDPARAYQIASNSALPNLLRFTVRRTAGSAAGRELLADRLADPQQQNHRLLVLEELHAAASRRGGVAMPESWPAASEQLISAQEPRIRDLARAVAVQFGDESVFPYFRQVLKNRQQPKPQRLQALASLRTAGDEQLPEQLFGLLDDQTVAADVAAALADFKHEQTADRLLDQLDDFDDATRTAALNTLVSRVPYARALTAAMESERLDPAAVPAFIVRQAIALDDDDLNERLRKTWGRITQTSEQKRELFRKYQQMLQPAAIRAANASRGRALYETNCGKCHKLFGTGGDIGPEITGANRTNVAYWLENILDPNALIGRAYLSTTFLTEDGRVIVGIILDENEDAFTVQTATEKLVLPKSEIAQQEQTEVSLMPEGQLQPMTEQQVRDLFKYLTGPGQVDLP